MASICSEIATRTSSELMDKLLGIPDVRSLPLTSIVSKFWGSGYAFPTVFFTISAALSPINRLYFLLIYWVIAKSILSPATLIDLLQTISARDMTATSVVPPPTSTTILPVGSVIGRSAPIAAAIGSSIKNILRAPADPADSLTARFSTGVIPEGTAITILGLTNARRRCTLRIRYRSIASVISKSAITPSRIGRITTILPGVLPSIFFASKPTAKTRFFTLWSV